MPRYDRPLWQIIRGYLDQMPIPFTVQQMAGRVAQDYPGFNQKSVRRCLRFMSVNSPRYLMSSVPKDILFKVDRSHYRPYNAEEDGPYDFSNNDEFSDESADIDEPTEEALEFALELHLEEFIEANWDRIDFGRPLRLYQAVDGRNGRQYSTEIGIIDLLCEDSSTGDLVVVELKKGHSSDRVLGQCQRYMGWVKENLASQGQRVRGLIIAPEEDERLRFALKVATGVELLCYRVDFQLFKPPRSQPRD